MNSYKILSTLLFLVVLQYAYCDVIPENSHYVEKCVKITNLNDYSGISLIGYIYGIMPSDNYIIDSTCLSKGYKFSSFDIYAVKADYLTNKDVTEIDWSEDNYSVKSNIAIEPYAGYYHDSIPIDKIEEYYKILGFTDTSVVIFKWKELYGFNNGSADSIVTHDYNGDNSQFYQNIPTGLDESKDLVLNTRLYPNPADNLISVEISNSYIGVINIQLLSQNGKILTENKLIKYSDLITEEFSTSNLTHGIYFLKLKFGDAIETKKIVIK